MPASEAMAAAVCWRAKDWTSVGSRDPYLVAAENVADERSPIITPFADDGHELIEQPTRHHRALFQKQKGSESYRPHRPQRPHASRNPAQSMDLENRAADASPHGADAKGERRRCYRPREKR